MQRFLLFVPLRLCVCSVESFLFPRPLKTPTHTLNLMPDPYHLPPNPYRYTGR